MPKSKKPKFPVMPKGHRVSARLFRSTQKRVADMVDDLKNEKDVTFRGRKFSIEMFVHVAVAHFVDLPQERQEEMIRQYVPRLEAMLLEHGQAAPASVPADSGPKRARVVVGERADVTKAVVDDGDKGAVIDPAGAGEAPPKRGRSRSARGRGG